MKKFLSVLLAAVMLLGLVPTAMADETTHIVFWHCVSDAAGQLIDEMVKEFNENEGAAMGVEVEAVYQGSYTDAVTKLNSILSSGETANLPDVMQLDATGKVAYFTSGVSYTVDAALADHADATTADFLPAALANWQYSGVQLGLPFATSTTVMYYNKTILDSLNLAAPNTFAEIAAMAAQLAETNADSELVPYASVPNTPTLANWLGQMGSDLVDMHNGSEGSATQLVCIDNGALASFLTAWKELYTAGGVVNNAGSTDAFAAGTQVLMTSSSSSVAKVLGMTDGRFEVGVAAYPRVNDACEAGATVSGSCLVAFDNGHKDAAWNFMNYMTSADIQVRFAAATGYVPSVASAAETDAWKELVAVSPAFDAALQQILATPASMSSVTVGPSADFYYAIMTCISDMLDQNLSVEETVEIMADELNGLLWQYNQANQ